MYEFLMLTDKLIQVLLDIYILVDDCLLNLIK